LDFVFADFFIENFLTEMSLDVDQQTAGGGIMVGLGRMHRTQLPGE
jgi:hypothetical protein